MDEPSNVYPSPKEEAKQEDNTKEETVSKPVDKKKMPKILYAIPVVLLFLVVIGVLAYLYLDKNSDYKKMKSDNQSLQSELEKYTNYEETIAEFEQTIEDNEDEIKDLEADIKKLKTQKSTLTSKNTQLEKDKNTLETQVSSFEQKQDTISKYNDFLRYVIDVVNIHGGFINLTEEEYQLARQKASATGDNDLVTAVDFGWNHPEVDQVTRFMGIMDAFSDGIAANL